MSYVAKSRSPLRRIGNQRSLGSNQSMPRTGRVVARALGGISEYATTAQANPTLVRRRGLGASAMEYVTKPVIIPVPPPIHVTNRHPAANIDLLGGGSNYNAWTGLGSLGDDNAASPADPSIGVDPVLIAQQQLAELKTISAAQVAFTKREAQQRWVQIAATVSIPLFAAVWRAIFRGGRTSSKDFE